MKQVQPCSRDTRAKPTQDVNSFSHSTEGYIIDMVQGIGNKGRVLSKNVVVTDLNSSM